MSQTPLLILDETASTNDAVRETAAARPVEDAAQPLWLMAHRQSAGRGRRGRAWAGLEGNLFLSGWRRLPRPPHEVAQLSFAVALAVADLADTQLEPERVSLKWPNDVLIDGAKVSGVLLECAEVQGEAHGSSHGETLSDLVIGVGVNVAAAPTGLAQPVTSLAHASGRPALPPEEAARRIISAYEAYEERWLAGGFEALRRDWLKRAHLLGAPISVSQGDRRLTGIFEDMDAAGALVLRQDAGCVRLAAGEVFPVADAHRPHDAGDHV